jgi:excisionase family DNA binding protein
VTDYAMTVRDLMKYLRISRTTAYGLVWDGTIPHFKVRNQIRVWKSEVDRIFRPSTDEAIAREKALEGQLEARFAASGNKE